MAFTISVKDGLETKPFKGCLPLKLIHDIYPSTDICGKEVNKDEIERIK